MKEQKETSWVPPYNQDLRNRILSPRKRHRVYKQRHSVASSKKILAPRTGSHFRNVASAAPAHGSIPAPCIAILFPPRLGGGGPIPSGGNPSPPRRPPVHRGGHHTMAQDVVFHRRPPPSWASAVAVSRFSPRAPFEPNRTSRRRWTLVPVATHQKVPVPARFPRGGPSSSGEVSLPALADRRPTQVYRTSGRLRHRATWARLLHGSQTIMLLTN